MYWNAASVKRQTAFSAAAGGGMRSAAAAFPWIRYGQASGIPTIGVLCLCPALCGRR